MISLQTSQASPFFDIELGIEATTPEWIPAFLESLSQDYSHDPNLEIGRLLCSAIVHGALLDPRLWDAWSNSLSRLNTWSSIAWIEVYIVDERSPAGYSTKRWFADPVTKALITKRGKQTARRVRTRSYNARECLEQFLRSISQPSWSVDQPCADLLRWATLFWRLRAPSLLIDQALGTLPTVSLNPREFSLLLGSPKSRAISNDQKIERPLVPARHRPPAYRAVKPWMDSFKKSWGSEHEAFEQAKRMWRNGALGQRQAKVQCIANLAIVLKQEECPARRRLLEWCQAGLEANRKRYKRGFAPYTVQQKLVVLLAGVFHGQAPQSEAELAKGPLLLRARAAAASESCLTRRRLIRTAVIDYLRFARNKTPRYLDPEQEEREAELEAEADEAQAIFDELENLIGSREATSVSANLISSRNYLDAVDKAYEECPNGELSLIIMLGFRTGMRLREILGLRTSDFVAGEWRLEVHLDHNHFRDLKTFQSRRIIPLNLFLTPNEQRAMKKWLAPRRARALELGKSLLCFGPVDANSMADEFAYGRQIGRILSTVSDRYVSFSHLRHSFGSFLLLNLLLPNPDSELLVPRRIRRNATWKRKQRLQSALLGRDRLGRSALHAVSQMMGHTGILRTLESYQHLLDLALGLYVNRQEVAPSLPPEAISALGMTVSAGAVRARSADVSGYRNRVLQKLEPLAPLIESGHQVSMAPVEGESRLEWFPSKIRYKAQSPRDPKAQLIRSDSAVKIGWRLLLDSLKAPANEAKAIAGRYGISPADLDRWRSRYRQVIETAFAPGALPDGLTRPRGHQAEQVVEGIWSQMPEHLEQSERELIQKFLNSFRPNRYHGIFHNLADAEAFAGLLRKIGFPADHIFIASGAANRIKSYKADPGCLKKEEDENETTLYRRPADLRELSASDGSGQSGNPVILWFRYIKFQRDALGLRFDRRYRLDAYQERKDEQLTENGQALPTYREKAAAKRRQRQAADMNREKSTVFAVGNKAYYFALLLAAVYYDIELDVQFATTPHSGNMKSRERRLAKKAGQTKG